MMLGRAASHTTEGSAATSGSTTEDLGLHSAQVLHAYWVKCHDLRAAIRARNHQGRPGRYRGEDTARVRFIDGWVMPSLLRGKLPTEHDDKMLFLGPKATLAIAAQVELAAWARDVNNRSASSAEELANPAYPQQTLQYVLTKTAEKLPATLKTGRPKVEYTFQTGTQIGKTLPQVLHSNPAYFYYLLGEGPGDKKVWKFDDATKVDEDWRLYVECEKLCADRGGTRILCQVPGSDPIVWNLGIRPDLKDAFETYVRTKLGTEESRVAAATEFERACAQRRASQAAQAGGEEDDEGEAPIVKEPTEEMSRVNAATLQLFRDTCNSLAKGLMDAYETWPNRIVQAPDPFKRVPFSKDAWECRDIDFFDVSFYGPLIDVTCLPCINDGYEHAADVRLRDSQWRKPRLVKGAERETCITGRNYVCRACERKYRSLQGQLYAPGERRAVRFYDGRAFPCGTQATPRGLQQLQAVQHIFGSRGGKARLGIVSVEGIDKPMNACIGVGAVGYMVARKDSTGRMVRGKVSAHAIAGGAGRWTLRYEDGSTEEGVAIAELNHRLKERFELDHHAGGEYAIPHGDAHSSDLSALRQKFLDGIDRDWATSKWSKLGYDALHFMHNCQRMLNIDKHSQIARIFSALLSDVLFQMQDGEKKRVYEHLKKMGEVDPERKTYKRSYWRGKAMYSCPDSGSEDDRGGAIRHLRMSYSKTWTTRR